jgi:DNA polymerase III subunit delta'
MPLSTIVGHRRVIDLLRLAVERNRVPQSLLLAGPDGVGKRLTAVALAQAVNCPKRGSAGVPADDACGVCPTCRRIAKGQHSDVVLLDRGDEPSIKIKPLREQVLEVVGYRPFEAVRRVYIIDPADDLTDQAQDALLKTLEEPPASAILVLVTAYPDTLSATIQSRCRRLRFGPLSEGDVARVLVERQRLDPQRAKLLAATSGGSVGRAVDEESGDLADDRDVALDLLKAAGKGREVTERLKVAAAFAKYGSDRRAREALSARLALVSSLCRDLVAIGAGRQEMIAHTDLSDTLHELARAFDRGRVSEAFDAVEEAQQALDQNASPKIVADWVALTI